MQKSVSDSHDAGAARPQPTRRAGRQPHSIADQIASHIAADILRGDYGGGDHIREQEIADQYGVSRGPVRDAIRILEKRGLVDFYPRRGAFAIDLSLDFVADFFNVRAALIGLSARCFALSASPDGIAALRARLKELRAMAAKPSVDAVDFAYASARASSVFYQHGTNAYLARMIRDQGSSSFWDPIWRERPVDLVTPARRRALLADWDALEKSVLSGDGVNAERIMRKMMFESRDAVLAALMALRKRHVDKSKLLRE